MRTKYNLPTRSVEVFSTQEGFTLSGTDTLGFVGADDFNLAHASAKEPFLLGGERPGGVRKEDMVEEMPVQHADSGLVMKPAGVAAEIRIVRCSCGLFDHSEPYGDRFSMNMWDIYAGATMQSIEHHILINRFLKTSYKAMLRDGKIPARGQGPTKAKRMQAVVTRCFTAKADQPIGARRAHCLMRWGPGGLGHPCDGTAAVALLAADCLLAALELGLDLRTGFGTPTWHLAHLGFFERMVSTWGGIGEIHDGPIDWATLKIGARP
eukprot:gnl/TRDRNA2_/TRDRNA2_166057_c1_seq2.p1 gnl/TRDRNA2_/TRDRNA2_166057_c1~~gnl/TRDRNA2_/TRDRNA2_166057_c1_seq2.p1  ORF type:complete len:266 (+),score=42.85 gnl/TRDRNA2_/TRDRNA2_166057_c1_seq2:434-1231(+)